MKLSCPELESKAQDFSKQQETKAMIFWAHKATSVTRKTYPGSENRGQKWTRKTRKEMDAGNRRMARHNNNAGSKISRGSFAVSKEGSRGRRPGKGLDR